jgi:hypothetical protein
MANVFRRLILKPPGAASDRLSRLAGALAEATSVQNRLAARSPYVLRFSGPLQEDDQAFFIAHEPATAWTPCDLFSTAAPTAAFDQLFQATAALLDALATAHSAAADRPVVHGGLCPGVVLAGEDGLIKLTDFGFAPAICKALGIDSYLNLAVGPHASASGAWEVLDSGVIDRDDRLCAFVDPDKYGQDALATFEPGSDIISAGFLLRLLAEHRHPYLFYEPDAHRVVDMAQMMSFGVPIPFKRKDLCEAASPEVRTWCELVMTMLARLPSERPSASELVGRFQSLAGPRIDLTLMKAQRWVEQLEAMLAAETWRELQSALRDRPDLGRAAVPAANRRAADATWPPELLARVAAVEQRVQGFLAEEARRAAIAVQHRTAEEWLARLQNAVQAGDWDAAQQVLGAKPQLEHWPEQTLEKTESLAARIAQAQGQKRAADWHAELQATFQSENWPAVGKLLTERPPSEHCSQQILDYLATVEAAHARRLEEQERERRRIASEHSQVRGWLERARALAANRQWAEAIDCLGEPPQVEHWPDGSRQEADRLREDCRSHLGDAVTAQLDTLAKGLRQQGEAIVREVIAEKLDGLVRADRVETTVELVVWAPPGTDADGRAPLLVRLRPPAGAPPGEPVRAELDFHLRENQAQICRGVEELRQKVEQGLAGQLARLQKAQLQAMERHLRRGVFSQAAVRAQLDRLCPKLSGRLHLLGPEAAEGTLPLALHWDAADLRWRPDDSGGLAVHALEVATAVTRGALLSDLVGRSDLLRKYQAVLSIELSPPSAFPADQWPKSLSFDARVAVGPAGSGPPWPLFAGTVVCDKVGQAPTGPDLAQIESKLGQLIVEAQDKSCKALAARLKEAVGSSPRRVRIGAPGRAKTPVDQIVFDLRPKIGQAVSLAAAWNPATFVYDLLPTWEGVVRPLLEPVPVPETRRPVEMSAAKKVGPVRRRRGLVVGTVAAGVGLAAVAAYLVLPRGGQAPPALPVPVQQPPVELPVEEAHTGPVAPAQEQPELPPGPTEAVETQPPVDLVQSLKEEWQSRYNLSDPKGLPLEALWADLLPADARRETGPVADHLRFLRLTAQPNGSVSDLRPIGEQQVSLTLTLTLKADAGAVSHTFVLQHAPDGWRPSPENAANLASLATAAKESMIKVVADARQRVEADVSGGRLVDAYQHFDSVKDLLPDLAGETPAAQLQQAMSTLPPRWEDLESNLATAGYRPADQRRDPGVGYPTLLQDAGGTRFLLVSLPPADPLWSELKPLVKPRGPLYQTVSLDRQQRPWRIFYVEAAESPADGYAQAVALAAQRGRALPTRDEWLLAALRLRAGGGAENLLGGLWEWCADEGEPLADGQHWLCGGSRLLLDRIPRDLALPRPTDSLQTWWGWLTHPLVMQRRSAQFGDQLTGLRTILRIHPPV